MASPRRYNRVEAAFWTDPLVASWSDDGRLLALYISTCPHRNTEGLFRLPKQYMAADLGWTLERLAEPFGELLRDGFLEYHDETSTCLLINALEVQAPENPNQVKACVSAIRELPASPLIARFYALSQRFCERLAEGLREGLGERLTEAFAEPLALTPALTPSLSQPRDEREDEFDIRSLPLPGSRVR